MRLETDTQVLHYGGDGSPRKDKDGNLIPDTPGEGRGCLVYPLLLMVIIGAAWYAIDNWL